MNAQVVCVSSHEPKQPYYHFREFKESLRRFGEYATILGADTPWRGLMTKPLALREWLRAGRNTSDRLIVCDAWDIVFAKHPHGIGDVCQSLYGDAIVANGEKGCWPRADLMEYFPDDGSPWRYLNSGFMCGPADRFLKLLEAMGIEGIGVDRRNADDTDWIYPNDQGEYQALFAGENHAGEALVYQGLPLGETDFQHVRRRHDGTQRVQPVPMVVDTQCQLAQTLSACEMSEFDFTGPHIRNKVTGTEPGVFHLNGGAKEIFGPAIFAKYNLP